MCFSIWYFCNGFQFKWVCLRHEPFKSKFFFFFFLQFYGFPGHILHCFTKPGVLVARLSCAATKGQIAWCGAQIPHPPRKITAPLWYLPSLDCCGWSVGFSLVRPYLCLSYSLRCCPFTLCCGDYVHPVFRSLSDWIIPYVVVYLFCPWDDVSLGLPSDTILNPFP